MWRQLAAWSLVIGLVGVGRPCWCEARIRVGLFRTRSVNSVDLECGQGCRVEDSRGTVCSLGPGTRARCSVSGRNVNIRWGAAGRKQTGAITVRSDEGAPITVNAGAASVRCRGTIRLSPRGAALLIVNEIAVEDYVRGVLPSEMSAAWPMEALKAQAVAIRTLAACRMGEHKSEGFDVCDTTHCQVYRGVACENPQGRAAVSATTGEILVWHGEPIEAYYCSTCGGKTSDSFGSRLLAGRPYLRSVDDIINKASACGKSPHYAWQAKITGDELAGALRADSRTNPGSKLTSVDIVETDGSGRASVIEIAGERTVEVDGYVFWNVVCRGIGWGKVKSARFTVRRVGATYVFSGNGLGHGVGMCQWGARRRAEMGWDYRKILGFYYSGADIRQSRG